MIKAVSEIVVRLKPVYAVIYRIEGNRFALISENGREYDNLKISLDRIAAIHKKPLVIHEK